MIKEYIGILIVGAVVALILITGFSIVGSPVSQRLVSLDTTRISDFSAIKSAIIKYYNYNKLLPANLDEIVKDKTLSYEALQLKDPETGIYYKYEIVTPTNYKLCTTFSVGSKDLRGKTSQAYLLTVYDEEDTRQLSFAKGYDCITYKVAQRQNYNLTSTPSPTIYQIDTTPQSFGYGEDSCKSMHGEWTGKECVFKECSDPDNTKSAGDKSFYSKADGKYGDGKDDPLVNSTTSDSCYPNYMSEAMCSKQNNGKYIPMYINFVCPKGCKDGACVK